MNKYSSSDNSEDDDEERPQQRKSRTDETKKCTYCCDTFTRRNLVLKHEKVCSAALSNTAQIIVTDEGKKRFVCDICNNQFKYLTGFKKHKLKHEPPGGFICRYCGETFCMENLMQTHKETEHLVYKCQLCQSTFTTKEIYVDHIMTIHDGQDRQYVICEDCGGQFKTNQLLLFHRKSNCGTTKPFKCEECGSNFRTKWSLKSHKKIHNGQKRFCCTYCGESFISSGQLKIHERIHTKEKPYVCDVCNKAFSHRESLVTHTTIHTGIKPYLCECCGSRFSCSSNIIQHRRRRPDSCGLPQYCTQLSKAAPRPRTKLMPKSVNREQKVKADVKLFKVFVADKNMKKQKKTPDKNLNHSETNINDDKEFQNNDQSFSEINIDSVKLQPLKIEEDFKIQSLDGDDKKEDLEIKSELIDEISILETLKSADEIEVKTDANNGEIEHIKEKCIDVSNELLINEFITVKIEEFHKSDNENDLQSNFIEHFSNFSDHSNDCASENKEEIKIQLLETNTIGTRETDMDETKNNILESTDVKFSSAKIEDSDDDIPLAQLSNINKTTKKRKLSKSSKSPLVENESKSHLHIKKKKETDTKHHYKEKSNSEASQENQGEQRKYFKGTTRKSWKKKPNTKNTIPINDQTYECNLCPKIFKQRTVYIRHRVNEHGFNHFDVEMELGDKNKTLNENALICKYCKKVYYFAASLRTHEQLHGPDGKLIHKCNCCPKYFETRKIADDHAQSEHADKLTCTICQKLYRSVDSLLVHKKYAHLPKTITKKIKQNICQKCGRKFANKSTLDDHERSDCGKNPLYECKTCHKKYNSAGSLKLHEEIHTGILPFKCSYCEMKFMTKSQAKVHERRHTGEKPFKCDFCPKAFGHRESLLTHVSLHTGIKRFLCEGCGQRFTCVSNLQAHRKAHSDTCGLLPLNAKSITAMGYDHGILYIGGKDE